MFAIIILILNYNFEKDVLFFNVLLLQIFAFSFIISLYHLGIEQGIISESAVCASEKIDLISKEDILNSLQELNVSCKDVTIKIFGLSLTTYNIFISILMFLLSTKIYLISHDIKK